MEDESPGGAPEHQEGPSHTSFDGVPRVACSSRLVGRADETRRIRDQLSRARDGEGFVLFLVGEAGIGKTRLLTETRTYARALGFTCLSSGCDETTLSIPYSPWIGLLTQLLAGASNEEIYRPIGPYTQVVVPLLPELGDRVWLFDPSQPPRTGWDPEPFLRALTQFLLELPHDAPML